MELEQIKEKLQEAMYSGEIIPVIYHGGSYPGAERMIFPVRIDNRGIWAQCIASDRVKRFLFEKIELPENANQAPAYLTDKKSDTTIKAEQKNLENNSNNLFPVFMTLLEQFEDLEKKHIQTSLHINGVELHQCFQNGKPQATPFFFLEYEESKQPPWVIYGLSKPIQHESPEAALLDLLRLANI